MTELVAASILTLAVPGPSDVRAYGVEVAQAEFDGDKALELRNRSDPGLVVIEGATFRDGEISLELAGLVDPDASPQTKHFARGFEDRGYKAVSEVPGSAVMFNRSLSGLAHVGAECLSPTSQPPSTPSPPGSTVPQDRGCHLAYASS